VNTTAGTLITYNPVTVSPDDSIAQVLRLMEECETHHVPVVDDSFHVLGIISDLDVARFLEFGDSGDAAASAAGERAWPDAPRSSCEDSLLCRDADHDALPTAGELMTRTVTALESDLAPLVALQAILDKRFHSIPITAAGRLTGIVTSSDFLREFASLGPAIARNPIAKAMSPWRPTIALDTGCDAARRAMAAHHADYLGVVEGVRPRGVLSARRLRRANRLELIADGSFSGDDQLLVNEVASIADVFGTAPETIYALDSLGEAAAILIERKLDGLAVIDDAGRVKGMITETDLLKALSRALARQA
jgi:CBS domain-containing protein